MTAKTFKQMVRDGEVRRADAMKVRLDDIHEEPGFNLRIEGEDLEQSINLLAAYILDGGQVPPLEVRPREEGGVWLVDGHRRRRAYLKARAAGAPIEWIFVVPFTGNDADRVTRIITSAEGRNLTPMEIAAGYKRLAGFGLSHAEIGRRVGRTAQHVEQLLVLANANTDVQLLVLAGQVSATEAVRSVREHGEGAGAWLQEQLGKAQAAGKRKVTASSIAGPRLKPREVKDLSLHVGAFYRATHNLPGVSSIAHTPPQALKGKVVEVPAVTLRNLLRCINELGLDQLAAAPAQESDHEH